MNIVFVFSGLPVPEPEECNTQFNSIICLHIYILICLFTVASPHPYEESSFCKNCAK